MMRALLVLVTAVAIILCFEHICAHAVSFETVIVGNPGNSGDVQPNGTFGAVDYVYRIGRYEVSNSEYVEFLNAVAASDTNGLFNTLMQSDPRGGLVRLGSPGSYEYEVKPAAIGQGPGGTDYSYFDKPVAFVTDTDGLRFANWLHNGQPTGSQNVATTEDGAYAMSGAPPVRGPNARWFIPNKDEWYKAAYHKNDGVTGNYWDYATATDVIPDNSLPSSDSGNSANYFDSDYTTGSSDFALTSVTAYANSESPYGTLNQAGNIAEIVEILSSGGSYTRGGSAYHDVTYLSASTLLPLVGPVGRMPYFGGFRIATIVPEPNSLGIGIVAATSVVSLLLRRRRGQSESMDFADAREPVRLIGGAFNSGPGIK
jgi:sulfatase modifying factor 1